MKRSSNLTRLFTMAFLMACQITWAQSGGANGPAHTVWDGLLQSHVNAAGQVNYKGFTADSLVLNSYLQTLRDNPPNDQTWTRQARMAFWINAYNAFTVQLIIRNYPLKSIKDIGAKNQIPFVNTPWDLKFIQIGKATYDLNNIEHGQLRKPFGDPRIHFAIVCASQSCPRLANTAYTAEALDSQLDTRAKEFLADSQRNKVTADAPQLSKIFDWYGMDFPKKKKFIPYVNGYAPLKISNQAKITYLDYDWSLNE
jgi:hypothetical protein